MLMKSTIASAVAALLFVPAAINSAMAMPGLNLGIAQSNNVIEARYRGYGFRGFHGGRHFGRHYFGMYRRYHDLGPRYDSYRYRYTPRYYARRYYHPYRSYGYGW